MKYQNKQQNGVYFYYLYHYNKNNAIENSICRIIPPVYATSTYINSYNLSEISFEENEYENTVIAYVIKEGEDYLFAFNSVKVTITPENDKLLWYLLIFGVVILIIIAGTLMLNQEVRKKRMNYKRKEI